MSIENPTREIRPKDRQAFLDRIADFEGDIEKIQAEILAREEDVSLENLRREYLDLRDEQQIKRIQKQINHLQLVLNKLDGK